MSSQFKSISIYTYLIFHLLNLMIMLYMAAKTLQMVFLCRCAIFNLWWVTIAIYFIFSVIVTIYFIQTALGYNRGTWSLILTIIMIITFIAFIYLTLYYLNYLQNQEQSQNCKCIDSKYVNTLEILAKIRYAILSLILSNIIIIILVALIFFRIVR